MTFVATPHPTAEPPNVELDYTLDTPGSILTYTVVRNGDTLRFNTVPSGDRIVLLDSEPEYGTPLVYNISGTYLPDAAPDWTETWASLAAWTGDTAFWSVAGGVASSSTANANIVRDASGTIQKIEVNDPSYARVELLDALSVPVASIEITDNVILTGTTSTSSAGGGSFSATLIGGTINAGADDDSWALSREYVGVPTRFNIVSLAQDSGSPLGVIGSYGSDDGELNTPTAVAISLAGLVLVADSANYRIQAFDNDGDYQFQFGSAGSGNGQFSYPISGIAVVPGSGDILVSSGNRVQRFDSAGNYLSQFGTAGSGNGQFNGAAGIAVDSGSSIWVADVFNHRVQEFNNAGIYQSKFGTSGSGNGQFNQPYDLVIDAVDAMFVVDSGNNRIQKFNSAGVYQSQFGTAGDGDGQFYFPLSIDRDTATGVLFVQDTDNFRVQKFSSAGAYQSQFGVYPGSSTQGIAIDNAANIIYVPSTNGNEVLRYALDPIPASINDVSVILPVAVQSFNASAVTQLDAEDAWLINPYNTGLSLNVGRDTGCASEGIEVSPDTKRTTVHQTRSVLLDPVGRRRWIHITQQDRKIGTWDLVLTTENLEDRDAILNFLAADVPFLLRSPAGFEWDLPDDWYSVGDVPDNRNTFWLSPTPAECGHHFNTLTLPLYPVDPPTEPTPPAWTYGQGYLLYETYADSLAAEPTYLDRLLGPSA